MSCLRRFRRDASGVAAVEFVLVAPAVITILVAMIDIGTALFLRFQLDTAVNAAANYAIVNASNVGSSNGASLANTLASFIASAEGSNWADSSVVVNNGPTASETGGTAGTGGSSSPADSCYCPTGTAPSITWGAAQSCGSSCPSGGYAGKFVLLSGSRNYSPLISGFGFATAGAITSTSMVQVQ